VKAGAWLAAAALATACDSAAARSLTSAWPATPRLPAAPAAMATPPPSSSTLPSAATTSPQTPPQAIYGRREHVQVGDEPVIQIDADLDVKAGHSTLYAKDISYFNKDGDVWVSFVVDSGTVMSGNRTRLNRRVLKDQRIRERDDSVRHVPLVDVDICIGRVRLPMKLSVLPRQGYTAPLRIGREDILRLGGVDPTLQFTESPDCPAPPPAEKKTAHDED
jgi:hypothetical protein